MKKPALLSLTLALTLLPYAQRNNSFSLFDQCKSYYNPAFTADDGKTRLSIIGEYQYTKNRVYYRSHFWNCQPGHKIVNTYNYGFSADFSTPVKINGKQKFGIGLNYSEKSILAEKRNNLRLNITYFYRIGKGRLTLGGQIDMIKDFADFRIYNEPYDGYASYISHSQSNTTFNAGAGIAYVYQPNNFHFGFSINQFLHPTLNYEGLRPYYQFRNTYSFIWGMDARLGKYILFKPSALYVYGRYLNSHDGITNFLFEYKQKLSLGIIGQFTNDILTGMRAGYRFGSLNINYSYAISVLSDYFGEPGIHSIGLSYILDNKAGCCPRRKGLSNSIFR